MYKRPANFMTYLIHAINDNMAMHQMRGVLSKIRPTSQGDETYAHVDIPLGARILIFYHFFLESMRKSMSRTRGSSFVLPMDGTALLLYRLEDLITVLKYGDKD